MKRNLDDIVPLRFCQSSVDFLLSDKQNYIQGEHKVFPLITNIYYKKPTWNTNIFFSKCNSTQGVFLQHISTLQHELLLFHGERLIDNRILSTCSRTCLQLL